MGNWVLIVLVIAAVAGLIGCIVYIMRLISKDLEPSRNDEPSQTVDAEQSEVHDTPQNVDNVLHDEPIFLQMIKRCKSTKNSRQVQVPVPVKLTQKDLRTIGKIGLAVVGAMALYMIVKGLGEPGRRRRR